MKCYDNHYKCEMASYCMEEKHQSHLMCFQSETSVFKFLQCSVNGNSVFKATELWRLIYEYYFILM